MQKQTSCGLYHPNHAGYVRINDDNYVNRYSLIISKLNAQRFSYPKKESSFGARSNIIGVELLLKVKNILEMY